MTRRKSINGIASGILGAFISRNNDLDGYWGIGVLYAYAQRNSVTTVRLNIFEGSIEPSGEDFQILFNRYRQHTLQQAYARGIPEDWITSEIIEVDFRPTGPDVIRAPTSALGNLFKATVLLSDDFEKTYCASEYGYCSPHVPGARTRSTAPNRP